MLFDIRKFNVHTLKDFFREYVMIVVGILTALGLEQFAASRHHAHMAAEARERILVELRANLADVRESIDDNVKRREALDLLVRSLQKDIKDDVQKDTINRKLAEAVRTFSVGFALPAARHEEWDVAVANLSASYMDPAALRRYAGAYAQQREIAELNSASISSLSSGPRLIDALTDVELQRADPVEVLKALNHMAVILNSTIGNLVQIRKQLEAAVAEDSIPTK